MDTNMSVRASAENLSTDNQNFLRTRNTDYGHTDMESVSGGFRENIQDNSGEGGNMCLELALEGERLCKAGDCRAGVAFFQAAIKAGTDDLRTLSAIYSQLGNAYFYLGDYLKAMQYHKHDLTLARTMRDKLGEAKSSGNLGNTLKVMGKFDEAMICCKRHLEIAQELKDKLSEGRALYNLGNIYHAKGKHIGRTGQQDPGEFPEDVRSCLQQAVQYYEDNLQLMRELNETAAQGRACGNLGNTYYLLGNFKQAIHYHEERLKIAREFGDKAAERRANSNLGNSHIFLGEFESAADHYKRTLVLAQELGDRAVEAQACYSLGNTYTLLRDYSTAIDYHLRHLIIAQQLMDRVGEGRACWSLGNAHAATGNHEKALYFASKHLEISNELGDPMGQATAQMNVSDLRKTLGLPYEPTSGAEEDRPSPGMRRFRVRRQSMEELDLIQDDLLDLIAGMQSKRMDEQRVALPHLPGLHPPEVLQRLSLTDENGAPDDTFLEMLMRCQGSRLEDQRSTLPVDAEPEVEPCPPSRGPTVPDEDFFSLIMRLQSGRMEDQRASVPVRSVLAKSAVGGGGNRKEKKK
uniref:G-protein-signaling modulator 2 n=1 Tax=Timema tahoe TaxID=61484 RepID=A0A7R9ILC6_9NEOP|nr:unnamed protein product [Timema tahoe]